MAEKQKVRFEFLLIAEQDTSKIITSKEKNICGIKIINVSTNSTDTAVINGMTLNAVSSLAGSNTNPTEMNLPLNRNEIDITDYFVSFPMSSGTGKVLVIKKYFV